MCWFQTIFGFWARSLVGQHDFTQIICWMPVLCWAEALESNPERFGQQALHAPSPGLSLLGCSFFAYSWKLPAYSWAFRFVFGSLFAYNWSMLVLLVVEAFLLTVGASWLTVRSVLNENSMDCKEINSTDKRKTSPPFKSMSLSICVF